MTTRPDNESFGGTPPTVFLVAGEPSGDRLGAALMAALARRIPDIRFAGVGGSGMTAQGLVSRFPMSELSLMGLLEVLPHLPRLHRRLTETADAVRTMRPALVVTIDAPGFNMRLLQRLRGQGIPLVHYVAPTVWAWRPGRVRHFVGLVDHLLALLPFEPPYFERAGVCCSYVGHPALELSIEGRDPAGFRARHGIAAEAKLLCLLPGSRRSELRYHLPIFREAVERLEAPVPGIRIVLPTLPELERAVSDQVASWRNPPIVVAGDAARYDSFAAADLALAASGTVILELARFGVPTVLAYRGNPVTAYLVGRLLTVRFAGLANILLDREVVPEFLQQACRPDRLADALLGLILDSAARDRQRAGQKEALERLGEGRPSERAAEIVAGLLAARGIGAAGRR